MSDAVTASELRKRVAGSVVKSETPADEDRGGIEAEQDVHGVTEAEETEQQQEKERKTKSKKGEPKGIPATEEEYQKEVLKLLGIEKRKSFTFWSVFRTLSFLTLGLCMGWFVNPRFAPVRPSLYHPDASPAREGVLSPNNVLRELTQLNVGEECDPVDALPSSDGSWLLGCQDGRVLRIFSDSIVTPYVDVGTEILGLAWGPGSSILVAGGDKGLLIIKEDKEVDVLSTSSDGKPFKFVNSVTKSRDDRIYFTDGSDKFSHKYLHYEALELGLNGRVLEYSTTTGLTTTLIERVACASGVALSVDEDFLLVSDAFRSQVVKVWVKGPSEGKLEFIATNLPGYPFQIFGNKDGTFWVALAYRRSDGFDSLHGLPLFKTVVSHFSESNWWVPKGEGWVLKLDEAGEILESLEDSSGTTVKGITSAKQHGDLLYVCGDHFFGYLNLQA